MLVLFVNPPVTPLRKLMRNFDCATESKGNYLYQPYDLLLMSARVPSAWDCELVDAVAEPRTPAQILEKIRAKAPKVIVLAIADSNWEQDFTFLRKLRSELPEPRLLVFGDSFQEPSACTEALEFCDGIIDNPFDIDFESSRGLMNAPGLKAGTPDPRKLKAPRVVQQGIARHSLFLKPAYRWPFARSFRYTTIFTAWGCPYRCTYCIMSSFPNLWREPADVLAEMEHVKGLGIRELYIGDRSFGVPRSNAIMILGEMAARDFGFRWSSYFHPDHYDPELLELMAKSGCHTLIIGVESANPETLRRFGRRVRDERLRAFFSHCRKLGIDVCGDFIIGLPGEGRGDVERTIRLSQALGLQYASFNVAAPLPGTSLRAEAIRSGKLASNERNLDSFGRAGVLGNGLLDGETIRSLRNRAVREFYLRPGYLMGRLARIRGPQQLAIQVAEGFQILFKSRASGS